MPRRLEGIAASSGPDAAIVVTLVESPGEDAPSVPIRRMYFFGVDRVGLHYRAALDASDVIGVAPGGAPVGAFEARAGAAARNSAKGLVTGGGIDSYSPSDGAARAGIASLPTGYVAADSEHAAAVRANATVVWRRALAPIEPSCGELDTSSIDVDVLASPSGRWVCVARTVARTRGRRCDEAVAHVVVLDDQGRARGEQTVRWRAGLAGPAQCAVRDDGVAVVFLPSFDGESAVFSSVGLRITSDSARPFATIGRAVFDAVPSGDDGWALLAFGGDARAPRATLAMIGDDGSARATRPLDGTAHALVGLTKAVLVVSSPPREAARLDVVGLNARGGLVIEQQVTVVE
jgi:hypothetical protein